MWEGGTYLSAIYDEKKNIKLAIYNITIIITKKYEKLTEPSSSAPRALQYLVPTYCLQHVYIIKDQQIGIQTYIIIITGITKLYSI